MADLSFTLKEALADPRNFVDALTFFLVRCPVCGQENWAPAVASGTCAICGASRALSEG
jgi:ribosomal protein S27E